MIELSQLEKKGKMWLSYEIIGKKIEFEISSEYQVKGNKGCVFRHLWRLNIGRIPVWDCLEVGKGIGSQNTLCFNKN